MNLVDTCYCGFKDYYDCLYYSLDLDRTAVISAGPPFGD